MVFLDRIPGDRHPVADRALVQAADRGKKGGAASCASGSAELPSGQNRAGGAGCAVVLEAALRVEPVELLHILPDRQVRRLDPGGAALSLYLPRIECGGGLLWRTARRSLPPYIRALFFSPPFPPLHPSSPP